MPDWFNTLTAERALSPDHAAALDDQGFVVLPGVVPLGQIEALAQAYDASVLEATGSDLRVGSTSNRLDDFVNRGLPFEALCLVPPLLEACCHVVGRPFKLSSFHARTVPAARPARRCTSTFGATPRIGPSSASSSWSTTSGPITAPPVSFRVHTDGPTHRWKRPSTCAPITTVSCWHPAGPIAAHVQWVGMARAHGEQIRYAAPLAPGSVHTEGRTRRHRLRRPHVARDSRAIGSTRTMGPRSGPPPRRVPTWKRTGPSLTTSDGGGVSNRVSPSIPRQR